MKRIKHKQETYIFMKAKTRTGRMMLSLVAVAFVTAITLGYGSAAQAIDISQAEKARENSETVRQAAEEKKAAARERAEAAKARAQEKVTQAKERLEGAKLKACEAREKRITQTMEQMSKRGTNHIEVITKISDRVQAFYTEKGRTVENYDALVADVAAKKQAAEQAVANAQSVGDVFSCDSDSPKIASQEFRAAHMTQVAALKEYRTAVKNLITAVKSAQSQTAAKTEGASNE